jgi:putative membrane protein
VSNPETTAPADPLATRGSDVLVVRGAIGGALMGLANLVPGISGGTMLLATGVYPGFVSAIAEMTTLRFRLRSIVLLGSIAASAALGILMLAGTVKDLVESYRWVMYSLFIGLTFGGVPLVWRMARPLSRPLIAGALGAFAIMVVMAVTGDASARGDTTSTVLVFVAGLVASAAMILPGVSGGYLLLLIGQYEPILGAIDKLKQGLLGESGAGFSPNLPVILDALTVVVPLGIGVVAGVVGISNLVRWLLERYTKATLGALLGLLFGAVVGLWPFQEARLPAIGETVRGQVITAENVADVDPKHWPVRNFTPGVGQVGGSLALIALGFGATVAIGFLGSAAPPERDPDPRDD